jgi:polyphosphate kinase
MTALPDRADPAAADAPQEIPADPERFLNRDLQWLEFNRRVLAQCRDERTPLLERVRFLAIFASNLDEFFMKRVGSLRRRIDAGIASPPWEPLSPAQQLTASASSSGRSSSRRSGSRPSGGTGATSVRS